MYRFKGITRTQHHKSQAFTCISIVHLGPPHIPLSKMKMKYRKTQNIEYAKIFAKQNIYVQEMMVMLYPRLYAVL